MRRGVLQGCLLARTQSALWQDSSNAAYAKFNQEAAPAFSALSSRTFTHMMPYSGHALNWWHSGYHFVIPEDGGQCNQTSTRARITKDSGAQFDASGELYWWGNGYLHGWNCITQPGVFRQCFSDSNQP